MAGIGLILLVVASINNFSLGWLVPGVAFTVAAFMSFVAAEESNRRRPS